MERNGRVDTDAMLIDLREQVRARSVMPALPDGWDLEYEHRPAHDEAFSGDFVIARAPGTGRLDLALVDVSGHGRTAGARSLTLHGAFGALLAIVSPEDFLPAANAFLLEQRWEEGFASAVLLSVELTTGAFVVAAAGHPPPVHLSADGARLLEREHGPVLGILADMPFPVHGGTLAPGDTLLLYTDGLVEGRLLDLTRGIAHLAGEAGRLLSGTWSAGMAARICDAGTADPSDDRTLVVLHRAPVPARDRVALFDA